MNPFAFLRERIAPDLYAAIREQPETEYLLLCEPCLRDNGQSRLDCSTTLREPADEGADARGRLRADAGSPVADLLHTAFESRDARQRGIAWIALVRRWLSDPSDVGTAVAAEIVDRFNWRPTSLCSTPIAFAEKWLTVLKLGVTGAWCLVQSGANGDHVLQWLAETPSDAEAWLADPTPFRRCRALLLIARSRMVTQDGLHTIRNMMTSDVDAKVRYRAVMTITALFQRTHDRHILHLLARTAVNESESNEARVWAYRGLYIVDGRQPRSPTSVRDVAIAGELINSDIEYVRSLLDDAGD